MDCFGPFHVKERKSGLKKFGVIPTCLYSREIHLEVLDDMTADALINALRCVICIRGPIRSINCDNGTNFVGASNELSKELKAVDSNSQIGRYFQQTQISFMFNAPNISHAGGVWERQIRNVRAIFNGMIATKYNKSAGGNDRSQQSATDSSRHKQPTEDCANAKPFYYNEGTRHPTSTREV